jgi:putative ABC transport system ATP-binding protein
MKREFILECESVTKKFGNKDNEIKAIKSTNIKIKKGSRNLIMGKSGSGKTTLLSMLEGIEKPTSGKVYYEGLDFYSLSEKKQAHIRGRNFGIVFQSFHLIPELTVLDNIKVPSIIDRGTFCAEFLDEIISIMEIEDKLTSYPAELSGGQKQRVAIARAMILKPDILFADEPTGNLDEQNSQMIIKLLNQLNSRYNITIVLVTHDSKLMKNPDCIFSINDGIVVAKEIKMGE